MLDDRLSQSILLTAPVSSIVRYIWISGVRPRVHKVNPTPRMAEFDVQSQTQRVPPIELKEIWNANSGGEIEATFCSLCR